MQRRRLTDKRSTTLRTGGKSSSANPSAAARPVAATSRHIPAMRSPQWSIWPHPGQSPGCPARRHRPVLLQRGQVAASIASSSNQRFPHWHRTISTHWPTARQTECSTTSMPSGKLVIFGNRAVSSSSPMLSSAVDRSGIPWPRATGPACHPAPPAGAGSVPRVRFRVVFHGDLHRRVFAQPAFTVVLARSANGAVPSERGTDPGCQTLDCGA